jgi:hypothetical protein
VPIPVQEQVDAVQVSLDRKGAAAVALLQGQRLSPRDDDHRPARRDPDLELDCGALRGAGDGDGVTIARVRPRERD